MSEPRFNRRNNLTPAGGERVSLRQTTYASWEALRIRPDCARPNVGRKEAEMHNHDSQRINPHTLMMIAMVVVAAVLLLGGAGGVLLIPLLVCGVMMMFMMAAMGRGGRDD